MEKYESREGHKTSLYFKEQYLPKLKKLITLCDYYRQKGNKTKQGLSYWISLMLDRYADEIFEEVLQKENVQLEWRNSTLYVLGKKSDEDKLIDKVMDEAYKNE